MECRKVCFCIIPPLDRIEGIQIADGGNILIVFSKLVNLVVLRGAGGEFGLVVDGLCDTEEIVVKPLPQALEGLPVYAGATLLGDGRVALILDVPGLLRIGQSPRRAPLAAQPHP